MKTNHQWAVAQQHSTEKTSNPRPTPLTHSLPGEKPEQQNREQGDRNPRKRKQQIISVDECLSQIQCDVLPQGHMILSVWWGECVRLNADGHATALVLHLFFCLRSSARAGQLVWKGKKKRGVIQHHGQRFSEEKNWNQIPVLFSTQRHHYLK